MWTALEERGRYQVALVRLEEEWQPADWNDAPRDAVIAEIAGQFRRLPEAQGWVFGYNTGLREGPRQWAVILEHASGACAGVRCRPSCLIFTA